LNCIETNQKEEKRGEKPTPKKPLFFFLQLAVLARG
jgi:hypothetical protein